ncbi:TPA: WbuC family cupin fold metalloprotein [Escherichia coli]|nr:WbuC family cupin fold metalloprotein [Escherichia coli]
MHVKVFTQKQLQNLLCLASDSARLRAHLCLHNSHQDKVQRILIGLSEGTYIPPHFHRNESQWEHFQVIDGAVDLYVFDIDGVVIDIIRLSSDSGSLFAKIEPHTVHTLVCRSQQAVVLEIKEGPFIESEAKVIPLWSYTEEYRPYSRNEIVSMLEALAIGDVFNIR